MDAGTLTIKREQSRTARMQQVTPFRSIPAGRLAEQGYVQREGREFVYYAPDAEVLLSEPFLDGHCFRLERSAEKPGLLGLAFEPVRGRRLPDIKGVLWLDEKTAELKSLDFEYTRVEVRQDNDRTTWGARTETERLSWGGRLEFDRMPDGVWFVRRFHIRMPMTATAGPDAQNLRAQSAVGLVAVKEDGAEVTGLRTASQVVIAEQPAGGAAVSGVIYDSTRARPLADATVFLVGTEYIATTDAAGAFRLENVPDGRYAVSFSHPRADSLILVPTPVEVDLKRGEVDTVALSLGRPRQVVAASAAADSAIRLRPLVATAAAAQRRLTNAGFYDRQRVGSGAFLTGEQFRQRPGARVLDMLQGLRGTYARPSMDARLSSDQHVFYQYRSGRRCMALLWVDGVQRPVKDLERIRPDDVEAVEVYSGDEVPMRFAAANSELGGPFAATRNAGNTSVCGAVVVWLKTPIP
jgi:carboxypeptidase family protein